MKTTLKLIIMILTSILISNFEFIVFYFIIDFYNMIFTIQVNTFI